VTSSQKCNADGVWLSHALAREVHLGSSQT
jgi:hypothetical protein